MCSTMLRPLIRPVLSLPLAAISGTQVAARLARLSMDGYRRISETGTVRMTEGET